MNILFLSEKFPLPLDTGGNVRTYHLLRSLVEAHDVTLVAERPEVIQEAELEHLQSICADVKLAKPIKRSVLSELVSLARCLVFGESFVVRRHFNQHLQTIIDMIVTENGTRPAQEHFDVVYFNHLDATIYNVEFASKTLKVLDEHNIVTNQVNSMIQTEDRLLRKWLLRSDLAKLRKYEVSIARRMDLILTCSDDDSISLSTMSGSNSVAVIPNGVDLNYFEFRRSECSDPPSALFVGTMDYAPCEQGVWRFCKHILPLVRSEYPKFEFGVVGKNPSDRLQSLEKKDSLFRLYGRVDDVRPYLMKSDVVVVPLYSGSGTRLKILEAMAAGIPVVATPLGAEGLPVRDGVHIFLAKNEREFADKVKRLLANPGDAAKMVDSSRQLVEQQFSWRSIGLRLLDELATVEKIRQN